MGYSKSSAQRQFIAVIAYIKKEGRSQISNLTLQPKELEKEEQTKLKASGRGTFLAVQWLRLRASNAGGVGSIPGQGTKILLATWHSQKKELAEGSK